MEAKKKHIYKKKMITKTYTVDEVLGSEMESMLEETGMKVGEMTRRAVKKFIKSGQEDAFVMLNVVNLIQTVNEMKDDLKPEQYEKLQQYTGNIMKIKGGK